MFVVIQVLYLRMLNFQVFGCLERVEVEASMVRHSQPSVLQNDFPFMFLFTLPGKCLGLGTCTLRSVHVALDM